MPTLALSDEQPTLGHPQVLHPQPEDLAATQPTEHHRRDHRPVPVGAQRAGQRVDLDRRQDPRQPPDPPRQWDTLSRSLTLTTRGQSPRDRVRDNVPTSLQVSEEPRDARQPPSDRARRDPRRITARHHSLDQPRIDAAGPLGGDEPKHISRYNLVRVLVDDPEEHPQVVRRSQYRVWPAPTLQELEIVVHQRHPDADRHLPRRPTRTDQTRIHDRHFRPSNLRGEQPPRLIEMSCKITCITSMSGLSRPRQTMLPERRLDSPA